LKSNNNYKGFIYYEDIEKMLISLVAYDMRNGMTYIGQRSDYAHQENERVIEGAIMVSTKCLIKDYQVRAKRKYSQRWDERETSIRLELSKIIAHHSFPFTKK